MKKPELLAPSGSLAMLETALAFGARAIYAGLPRYSPYNFRVIKACTNKARISLNPWKIS